MTDDQTDYTGVLSAISTLTNRLIVLEGAMTGYSLLDDRLAELEKLAASLTSVSKEIEVELPPDDGKTLNSFYPDMEEGVPWEIQHPVFSNDVLAEVAQEYKGPHNVPALFITIDHCTTWEMARQIIWNSFYYKLRESAQTAPDFREFRFFFPEGKVPGQVYPVNSLAVPNLYVGIEPSDLVWVEPTEDGSFSIIHEARGEFQSFGPEGMPMVRPNRYVWEDFQAFQSDWVSEHNKLAEVA